MATQQLPDYTKQSLEVARRAEELLVKPNNYLDIALVNQDKYGIPPIQITPLQGQHLALLLKVSGARSILELGTLGGYSTLWLASVPGVHVTTVEVNPTHQKSAKESTAHLSNIDFRLGAATEVLAQLASEGKVFDFVLIDADWSGQAQYFDLAVKVTRKGGAIYADNVIRNLLDNDRDGDVADWSFVEQVQKDERVEVTVIPTVNTQMREVEELVDGFLLAVVK